VIEIYGTKTYLFQFSFHSNKFCRIIVTIALHANSSILKRNLKCPQIRQVHLSYTTAVLG
jgi:hypothetical protein